MFRAQKDSKNPPSTGSPVAGNGSNSAQLIRSLRQAPWGQIALSTVSLGAAIAANIEPSKSCAANRACYGWILDHLSEDYRADLLLACGGLHLGLTGSLCLLESIPELQNYIKDGSKWLRAGSVLTVAAFPSVLYFSSYSFPKAITTSLSTYAISFAGAVSFVTSDFPKLKSMINHWRNRHDEDLYHEYTEFQKLTASKWEERLLELEDTVIIKNKKPSVDENKNPSIFLYETKAPERRAENPRYIPKFICGTAGTIVAVNCIAPLYMNTLNLLRQRIAEDESSQEMITGLAILAIIIEMNRARTILGKAIGGSLSVATWSKHRDIDLLLHPYFYGTMRLLGITMAFFSFAMLEEMARKNFDGEFQEDIADTVTASSIIFNMIFTMKFISSVLHLDNNYWYRLAKIARNTAEMTFEGFVNFARNLDPVEQGLRGIHGANLPPPDEIRFTADTLRLMTMTPEPSPHSRQTSAALTESKGQLRSVLTETKIESPEKQTVASKKKPKSTGWSAWFFPSDEVHSPSESLLPKDDETLDEEQQSEVEDSDIEQQTGAEHEEYQPGKCSIM